MTIRSWTFVVLFLAEVSEAAAQSQALQAKRLQWEAQLAEPVPARRRGALREIPMWDPQLESTFDLVFQRLADPDPETRIEAGQILVRIRGDARAVADLLELAGPQARDKNTRLMALMAIARVPDAFTGALDTLRSYTSDPDVSAAAKYAVEAVDGRQKWNAARQTAGGSAVTQAAEPVSPSTTTPTKTAARPKRGPGGQLWLGLFAIGFGALTLYLRFQQPERLGKLQAMQERWGDDMGTAIHWVAYTVVPLLVGLVLVVAGLSR